MTFKYSGFIFSACGCRNCSVIHMIYKYNIRGKMATKWFIEDDAHLFVRDYVLNSQWTKTNNSSRKSFYIIF